MDEEVRRLLRLVAEDETLPPSAVSDAELLDKARAEPASTRAGAAPHLGALWRRIRSLARQAR